MSNTARLVITPQNRFYLSGFTSSLGYLFLFDDRKILYVDGRYIEAAQKGVNLGVEVRCFHGLSEAAAEISRELALCEVLCEVDITVRQLQVLQKQFGKVKVTPSLNMTNELLKLRSVKIEHEVAFINMAQQAAEKAFCDILEFIRVGVTEKEIALRLEYAMRTYGAEGVSFETIAVSGKNSSKPHGVPTDKPVENGEFITMDFGAVCGGYCSDMTRTVAVGYATDEMLSVYNTVLSAQLAGIEALKAGVAASSADSAARSVIENAGYGEYFTHSLGHGVGIDIHEQPTLSPKSDEALEAGNIVTCEPGIYIPEKFGVRIEDMLLITEKGHKNLTNSEKKLIILK